MFLGVSIPNGLPRPFSRKRLLGTYGFKGVSIPNGLPRPFSHGNLKVVAVPVKVSIPNGLPRPFSLEPFPPINGHLFLFQSRTGSPGHLATAAPHTYLTDCKFQSRTGSPGHLAISGPQKTGEPMEVSIPNGLPRPFSRRPGRAVPDAWHSFNPERAPQAI